jgi:hypothetical protein
MKNTGEHGHRDKECEESSVMGDGSTQEYNHFFSFLDKA